MSNSEEFFRISAGCAYSLGDLKWNI